MKSAKPPGVMRPASGHPSDACPLTVAARNRAAGVQWPLELDAQPLVKLHGARFLEQVNDALAIAANGQRPYLPARHHEPGRCHRPDLAPSWGTCRDRTQPPGAARYPREHSASHGSPSCDPQARPRRRGVASACIHAPPCTRHSRPAVQKGARGAASDAHLPIARRGSSDRRVRLVRNGSPHRCESPCAD